MNDAKLRAAGPLVLSNGRFRVRSDACTASGAFSVYAFGVGRVS